MTTNTLVSETNEAGGGRIALDPAETAHFDAVVRRSSARLVQMLDFVFLDREMAADAAQEAFVQLFLHWDDVGGSMSPEAWLYRVAVNRGRDYRRRLARSGRLIHRLAAASTAEAGRCEGEFSDGLFDVLRGLPLKQRTAAALFYKADMPVAEVAAVMGISEGAVNSHLNRARRALRQILEVER